MIPLLETNRRAIADACTRYRVARLHAFGSAGRDDYRSGSSDVDLLVEFEAMDPHDLVDAYFGLLDDLRTLLCAPVDLVMFDAVKNPYVASAIDREKRLLYAA
jgi:uncharacterized protein